MRIKNLIILFLVSIIFLSCKRECEPVQQETIEYSLRPVTSMPIPVYSSSAIFIPIQNKIYVFGGRSNPNQAELLNTILIYDIQTDNWELLNNKLPYGIIATTLATDNLSRIYLAPGIGPFENYGWGLHNKLIEFDFIKKESKEIDKELLDIPVWGCDLAFYNNILYIFGGWTGEPIDKVWKYLPSKDTLIVLKSNLPKASHLDLVYELNSKIYLIGGHTARAIQSFDPQTETLKLVNEFQTNEILDWASCFINLYPNQSYLVTPRFLECFKFNLNIGSIEKVNLPDVLNFLKDYSHPPEIVQLSDGKFFIFGGIKKNGLVTNESYILEKKEIKNI